ncbi:MAG: hypothetical protein JNM93_01245 [Bacteriovoracaceae bacterium]|nr:hypothetical protein [Bacteriovoracaceae bacterium]
MVPYCPAEESLPPGIFTSLKKLIAIDQKVLTKKNDIYYKNPKKLKDLEGIKDIKIDPDFLNTMILHSPSKYWNLARDSSCLFFNLLNTDLLKTNEGMIRNILIQIQTKEGTWEPAVVSKADYLKKVVPEKCHSVMEAQFLFRGNNLKTSFEKMTGPKATTMDECLSFHNEFQRDYKTAYYCNIYEKIHNANRLKTQLSRLPLKFVKQREEINAELEFVSKMKNYITQKQYGTVASLCENLNEPTKYCQDLFNNSFWNKILTGEQSFRHIEPICEEITQKTKVTAAVDAKKCVSILNQNDELCTYATINKFSALTPKPLCNEISKAMNYSRLYSFVKDCPGQAGNEAVTNIARIIRHFDSSQTEEKNSLCSTNNSITFAEANIAGENADAWGFHACYYDKIKEGDECLPVIVGNSAKSELDMGKVAVGILLKLGKVPTGTTCKVVDDQTYNPGRLEYKSGCYFVVDHKSCLASKCQVKIILQEKEVTGVEFRSDFDFDYIRNNVENLKYTQLAVMTSQFDLEHKTIKNTTELAHLLKAKENAIVHGIGCAEDILPQFFQKNYFNQCHPLPFIVDGFFIENDTHFVVVRTALDDIQAPRIINWGFVYNGLKNYQNLHPLQTWSFNATY